MRFVLGLWLSFTGLNAQGMECSPLSPKEINATAGVAFVGKVQDVAESKYKPISLCWDNSSESPGCGGKLVTFTVTEVLRGTVPPTVSVISEDGCYCLGQYWSVGQSYLVIAKPNTTELPGDLEAANVCEGTGEAVRQSAVIEVLRAPAGDG